MRLELYFDPSGRGRVAIRHHGVTVIDGLAELTAYGLEASAWAQGHVLGALDGDFLEKLLDFYFKLHAQNRSAVNGRSPRRTPNRSRSGSQAPAGSTSPSSAGFPDTDARLLSFWSAGHGPPDTVCPTRAA